jgi:signal transduction histidine kinase
MPNFTTRSTGSGLGLAMVKSIVTQMSGNVAFRTQVGKGSSFFVILPLDQKV